MRVWRSKRFEEELDAIVRYIAQDSPNNALNFERRILEAIEILGTGIRFRKSIHADDPNIRDFVFKGYVMPFQINEEKNEVTVLGIYGCNRWKL